MFFEQHIRYLKKNFQIVSFEDRLAGDAVDKKVIITFDDGYVDNYNIAYPILKKYKIPATIFLITDIIGTNKISWFDKIRYAFIKTEEEILTIASNIKFNIKKGYAKKRAVNRLLILLNQHDEVRKSQLIAQVLNRLNVDFNRIDLPRLMLNWDEIREMSNNGITFGSHTCSHADLSTLSSDKVQYEIMMSKEIIERKIDKKIKVFAYPGGKFNNATKNLLKKIGYLLACTTSAGFNNEKDNYDLKRIGISASDPMCVLAAKVFKADLEKMLVKLSRKKPNLCEF